MCVRSDPGGLGTIWGSGPEPLSFLISPGAQEAPSVPTLRVAPAPHLPAAQTRQASPPPCFPGDGPSLRALSWSHKPVVTGLEKSCSLTLPDRQIGTDGREEKARAVSAVTGGLALHWPHSLELFSSFVCDGHSPLTQIILVYRDQVHHRGCG